MVQDRVHIPTENYVAWVDGKLEELPLRFDVDPYVLSGNRLHGLGVRLSAGELLNVATGAGSAVPAFIVEDD